MKNNKISFDVRKNLESVALDKTQRGYKQSWVPISFDVRLDVGFTRKAIFVAYGHKVDTPILMTYASVMSRDSVSIFLMLTTLNGLGVHFTDIQNAYLNSNPKGKIFFYSVEDFIKDKGKLIIVIHAYYGLKGTRSTWVSVIIQLMMDLGL